MPTLLKRFLLGRPLPTTALPRERLGIPAALAVFSSDGLSSVAYATEEILLVLIVAGSAAAALSLPIGLAIAAVIFIVAASYSQTIHAYPGGGGSYVVSKENLGEHAGLVAGALIAVWMIALVNLRGVRESGAIFSVPTYGFIGAMYLLIGVGLLRVLQGDWHPPTHPLAGFGWDADLSTLVTSVGWFQILRAFAGCCVAVTGIEAISNGVQAFRPPEADNAVKAMRLERTMMYTMFGAITLLAFGFQAWPKEDETVLSQVAREVFGGGPLYYAVQATTATILLLAANTAYADFPRLASLLARDRFLPRQLANRGDRLVFSNGIVVLSALSSVLLVAFHGKTHLLIPLYAVGVFLAFTLSQTGMVVHWMGLRGERWIRSALLNGVGAVLTAVVLVVIAATKLTEGAWIVVLLLPCVILLFRKIRRHYLHVASQLTLEGFREEAPTGHTVVVPVSGIHRGVVTALHYAQAIASDVEVVTVGVDPVGTEQTRMQWAEYAPGVPLVVLDSPYRSVVQPIREYLENVKGRSARHLVTVVLPEFVPAHWWEHLLHNQTALALKAVLLYSKGTVVTSVPHHLAQ
jgi:amino acid transporter